MPSAALLAEDTVTTDHRAIVGGEMTFEGVDAFLPVLRGVIELGVTDIELRAVAVRGERLALVRTVYVGADLTGPRSKPRCCSSWSWTRTGGGAGTISTTPTRSTRPARGARPAVADRGRASGPGERQPRRTGVPPRRGAQPGGRLGRAAGDGRRAGGLGGPPADRRRRSPVVRRRGVHGGGADGPRDRRGRGARHPGGDAGCPAGARAGPLHGRSCGAPRRRAPDPAARRGDRGRPVRPQ